MPVLADRVGETSTAVGNGAAFALLGAKLGYQSFDAGIGAGVVTYYAIVHRTSGQWEVGIGSVTAGVLTRTTVLSGTSGAGVRVNFTAGTSDVFESLPSSKMGYVDPTSGVFVAPGGANVLGTLTVGPSAGGQSNVKIIGSYTAANYLNLNNADVELANGSAGRFLFLSADNLIIRSGTGGAQIVTFGNGGSGVAVRLRIATGAFSPTTVASNEGEFILCGSSYLRSANGGTNSTTYRLIGLNTGNRVDIDSEGRGTVFGANIIIPAAALLRLDGDAVGDTYIYESSANTISFVVGTQAICSMTTIALRAGPAADLVIESGKRFYLDGGGDTYFSEFSANNVLLKAGNTEVFRGDATGAIQFASVGTTASAANAFLDGGSLNNLLRSTSSRRYKKDIRDMSITEAARVVDKTRAITYRSRAVADDQRRTFVGVTAEEMARVDRRFVHLSNGKPDGVMYDRLVVPMLKVMQSQRQQLAAQERRLRQIERRIAA